MTRTVPYGGDSLASVLSPVSSLRPSAASPLFFLVAVMVEIARPGARPRVRSLLERGIAAVERATGSQSVLLWRLFIAFELHIMGSKEGARRVFFRAINACPW